MEPLVWTTEPPAPSLPRDEAIRLMNGGALQDVETAFREGVLVDYEKKVIGDGNDLEIRIVLRHRSAVRPAES